MLTKVQMQVKEVKGRHEYWAGIDLERFYQYMLPRLSRKVFHRVEENGGTVEVVFEIANSHIEYTFDTEGFSYVFRDAHGGEIWNPPGAHSFARLSAIKWIRAY